MTVDCDEWRETTDTQTEGVRWSVYYIVYSFQFYEQDWSPRLEDQPTLNRMKQKSFVLCKCVELVQISWRSNSEGQCRIKFSYFWDIPPTSLWRCWHPQSVSFVKWILPCISQSCCCYFSSGLLQCSCVWVAWIPETQRVENVAARVVTVLERTNILHLY